MRKLVEFVFLFSLVVTLAFPFTYLAQAATVFSDTFSGDLSSWSSLSGSWGIESPGELSQDDEVIVWTSIVAGEESLTDYAVEARVKLLTGGDSYAGILFRYNSGLDFPAYWFGLRYQTQTVQLDRWTMYMISSVSFGHVLNEWYVLRVEVSGDTINCYVDDVLTITAINSDLPNGKIGFSTARAHVHFDDVNVENPIPNFNVVPEYPLGTVLGLIMMLAALGLYKSKRIRIHF